MDWRTLAPSKYTIINIRKYQRIERKKNCWEKSFDSLNYTNITRNNFTQIVNMILPRHFRVNKFNMPRNVTQLTFWMTVPLITISQGNSLAKKEHISHVMNHKGNWLAPPEQRYWQKVVSLYGASPYCLFPGCIVTWAWSLAKGQYMVSWLLTGASRTKILTK